MVRILALCLTLGCLGPASANSAARGPETSLSIDLGAPLEIGRTELLFGSIVSVCEDGKGDFYVLDQREQKVLKFSPDGKRLGAFGRKGQGPGDFQSPGRIAFTPAGELAVFEDIALVSFHKPDGAFIRRLDLSGRLGLGYIGPDRFYGWEWEPEAQRQVLVDAKNSVIATFHSIPRDRFSAVLPDETGRMVMFNYSPEAYVPRFLYAYSDGLSAVGISDRYEIALLDGNGRTVATLRRDLRPPKISAKERDFLERGLADFVKSKNWPDRVARELAKKIPAGEGHRPRGPRFAGPGFSSSAFPPTSRPSRPAFPSTFSPGKAPTWAPPSSLKSPSSSRAAPCISPAKMPTGTSISSGRAIP